MSVSPSAVWINNLNVKSRRHLLTRATTDFVSTAPVIFKEGEQLALDGGAIKHFILWEKNIRCQDTGLKYTSYIISNLSCCFWWLSGESQSN